MRCNNKAHLSGDGLRVQGVDVLASGQHTRVADGVTAWSRLHIAALQASDEGTDLIVLHNLLKAELEVPAYRRVCVMSEAYKCSNEARLVFGLALIQEKQVRAAGGREGSAAQGTLQRVLIEASPLGQDGQPALADAAIQASAVCTTPRQSSRLKASPAQASMQGATGQNH
eukprot:scaffold295708_cov19-Tisochrysis_lutea.AAC.1